MSFAPVPYAPRPIRRRDLIRHEGWTLKRYVILYNVDEIDEAVYAEGLGVAMGALPRPASTDARPGVGFVICHQGAGVHYIVLNWWDNENELFQRVFIRGFEAGASWADGAGKGSFCVWDAEVIAMERDAYVKWVLTQHPDVDGYVNAGA